ncbi:MAG: phasin [Bradyrhizobiaceae bacterium]|nr:phasin [Bradyrhizobiaceae bacterium]
MADIETPKETVKKAAKSAAPKFEAPKFEAPKVVVPEVFREMAEKSVEQAKEGYARIRTAAEEATDVVEDTYIQATRGLTEFNMKAIEALRDNVNSSFDFARELLAAKSLSEAVELSATHMRQQFETLAAQAKDFSALAQKLAADAAEPMKASVTKNIKLN